VLIHFGVVGLPGRVRDPDRKGNVEAAIGHTHRPPLAATLRQVDPLIRQLTRHLDLIDTCAGGGPP
jgi:hypothetical protein